MKAEFHEPCAKPGPEFLRRNESEANPVTEVRLTENVPPF